MCGTRNMWSFVCQEKAKESKPSEKGKFVTFNS